MLCHRGEKVIHHGRKRSQNVIIEGFVLFYGGWGRTNMPLCMENYGEPVFLFSILLLPPPNIMSERQTQIFTRREPRFHALCDQQHRREREKMDYDQQRFMYLRLGTLLFPYIILWCRKSIALHIAENSQRNLNDGKKKVEIQNFTDARCLKIREKVSFNISSEASYVYIMSGQKLIENAKNGHFWRVFEKVKLEVKQCYNTGQF